MKSVDVCPVAKTTYNESGRLVMITCEPGRLTDGSPRGLENSNLTCVRQFTSCPAYRRLEASGQLPATRQEAPAKQVESPTRRPTERERVLAEVERIRRAQAETKAAGKTGNPIIDINDHDKNAAREYAEELKRREREKRERKLQASQSGNASSGMSDTVRRDIEAQRKAAQDRSTAAKEAAAELRRHIAEENEAIKRHARETAARINEASRTKREQNGNGRHDETPRSHDPSRPHEPQVSQQPRTYPTYTEHSKRTVTLRFERRKLIGRDVQVTTIGGEDEESYVRNLTAQGYKLVSREVVDL